MATLSLCMIVKNEADVLARCLNSVMSAVDEILIVDTGSTDDTKEIARRFTSLVYDFEWIDDFSAARNFSFSKATMDYCLWLDADDVVEQPERLEALKKSLNCDVVMMPYQVGALTYYRERVIRRQAGLHWEGAVHEAISPAGTVLYSDIAVVHRKEKAGDPKRNLRIYEKQLAKGVLLSPRDRFYYARELTYHGRDEQAIQMLEELLKEGSGWLENLLEACRLLADCYGRMGEHQKKMAALLHSFTLDTPRAELCCDLGDCLLQNRQYAAAAFWFETALNCPRRDERGGFILPDRYGIYPALQLCLCYHHLGDGAKAVEWNEFAAQLQPDHPAVVWNRNYFGK